ERICPHPGRHRVGQQLRAGQIPRTLPLHGGFQEAGNRHRHGAGDGLRAHPLFGHRLVGQRLPIGAPGDRVSAHHRLHSGHRRRGPVHRNRDAQDQSRAVSSPRHLSPAHHHQLRGARGCPAQPAGAADLRRVGPVRFRRRRRLLPGAGPVRGHSRAGGCGGCARALPRQRHRTHHRRPHVPGLHGFRRSRGLL
ncbi:MAG: Electron transport complex protein RnfA, partial [Olavius algarvensis Gamma 1 endosymbiont]